MNAEAWGIESGFEDARGGWREAPAPSREAILRAMGAEGDAPPRDGAPVAVRAGTETTHPFRGDLALEDGTRLAVDERLPPGIPLGYHELRPAAGAPRLLIVHPGACHRPSDLEAWGFAVQLYATRSTRSWGIGDFSDLGRLARWAGKLGAEMLLLNPLGAATPVSPQETSPYAPSSRIYRNLLYLRIEAVPGAAEAGADLERLAAAGRDLDHDRRIDRDAVFRLKREALELVWRRFEGSEELDGYRAAEGAPLARFATFCALAEHHRSGWRDWPAEHRHPDSPAVSRFAAEHAAAVRFHEWVQWLLDRQHAAAASEAGLMHDLAVGFEPDGADAWAWQDLLATGATVGAPPDEYNTQGQDWGLPPFIPHRLRAAGYDPFLRTIRASLRHAKGLRIDHVMGLFRLYWIPGGLDPAQGAYVRYPSEDLLAIVALESARARAIVVGEDLGTVEERARQALRAHRVLSYRLLWFEEGAPEDYLKDALVAVTTHDLPTVAGLWTGADIRRQRAHGVEPNEKSLEAIRDRLVQATGLAKGSVATDAVRRTYDLLSRAPSAIVMSTLEDALAVEERPNLPGIVAPENWSLALPQPLESVEHAPLPRAIAESLNRRKKQSH